MESGVGGKTYQIMKSMYTNNKCAVKIGQKHRFLSTGRERDTAPNSSTYIYSALGKYSNPSTIYTFCYATALF
jgi:hypothetical protein